MSRKRTTKECAFCKKPFQAEYRSDRGWQKYCNRECYYGTKNRAVKKIIICPGCNTEFLGKENRVFCSTECNTKKFVAVKYTDNELIYLASLNPGFGFTQFHRELYAGNNSKVIPRLFEIFENWESQTGIDLFDTLQDPSKMIKMPVDKYFLKYGHIPSGTGGGRGASRGVHETIRRKSKTSRRVKTDKHLDFNWGTVKRR